MPDARSPIRHHLVLHRRDPEQGRAWFFSLMIERDLFGTIRLVRSWGTVGSKGQEKSDIFLSEVKLLGRSRAGPRPSGRRAMPTSDVVGSSRAATDLPVRPCDGWP
jgi:predicted DNA-binding WGR domain protein